MAIASIVVDVYDLADFFMKSTDYRRQLEITRGKFKCNDMIETIGSVLFVFINFLYLFYAMVITIPYFVLVILHTFWDRKWLQSCCCGRPGKKTPSWCCGSTCWERSGTFWDQVLVESIPGDFGGHYN